MARLLYGVAGGDVLAQVGGDGDFEPTTAVYEVFTTRTGSTRHTDLQTIAAVATSTIIPDATHRVMFFGVDGYIGSYWLENVADRSATRWLVNPVDLAERAGVVGVVDHGALTGLGDDDHAQYHTDARGDARYPTIANTVQRTIVDAKGDLIVGTAADTVTRKAIGAEGTVPVSRAAQATGIAWEALPDPTLKADKSGSVRQFSDVPDTALAVGETYVGDGGGNLEAFDVSNIVDAFDPSTGRLFDARLPLYHPALVVVEAGQPAPPGTPTPYILLRKQATASIVPSLIDEGFVQGANNNPLTSGEGYAVGDDVILVIGASNEVGSGGTPVVFGIDVTPGTGAITGWGQRSTSAALGGATAVAEIWQGRVTTAIPPATAMTVTAYDPTGVTPQNRVHFLAALLKVSNLAASAFDQGAAGGQTGGNTTLTKTVSTGGATSQSNEVAIMGFVNNSGVSPAERTPTRVPPFNTLSIQKSSSGSARSLLVTYRILTVAGTVDGSVLIDPSTDGTSGGYAQALATFKGL